ncbi:MAG: hypothetical protein KAI81_07035 [Candidatus Marinimicrobia bacterium]|nr:hypothetical protein [Candidatus Neomarinimicrobiota bacterium]
MDKFKLTPEEQYIEDHAEEYVEITGKKKEEIENIIRAAAKKRSISLRLSNQDYEGIKNRANQEGLPYQTLITSILHKYINNQLVDKNEMISMMGIIQEQSAKYGK